MKQKDILLLSISAFVLIMAWIAFSIYHNSAESTISEPIEEKIVPIAPDFNTKIIDDIKNKRDIQPLYEIQVAPKSSTTQSPEPRVSETPPQEIVPTQQPIEESTNSSELSP